MTTKKRPETNLVGLPGGATVAGPAQETPPPNPVLDELITAENYRQVKPPKWFVPGWVIEGGTTALYGEPGAGKSFWTLGLALEAARGGQWCHHKFTEPKRVLYLAPEARESHVERVRGWAHLNGTDWPENFYMTGAQVNIYTDESVSHILKALKEIGSVDLVVLDTLASATAGLDENSSQMNVVTQNLEQIRRAVGPTAPMLIVHHTGKDKAKGLRGHTSLLGYVSGSMLIEKTATGHTLTSKKVRDGREPLPLHYRVESVLLDPEPGELLAREVGVMVPVAYTEAVQDNITNLYTQLLETGLKTGDTFTRKLVQELTGLGQNTALNALNRGADRGLWTKDGNGRTTYYRLIGKPGDIGSLVDPQPSDIGAQDALPDLGNLI